MTTTEIRSEIVELVNGGMLNVSKIKSYFKQHKPDANINVVADEAKELVAETKMIMKRGY